MGKGFELDATLYNNALAQKAKPYYNSARSPTGALLLSSTACPLTRRTISYALLRSKLGVTSKDTSSDEHAKHSTVSSNLRRTVDRSIQYLVEFSDHVEFVQQRGQRPG